MTTPLPEFESPPVDEVALGVDFLPLPNWKVPYSGLFWETIRDRYPSCDVQPTIFNPPEQFGVIPPEIAVRFYHDPNAVRCWFLDDTGNHLVQLQPDKFLRNWRRLTGNEPYPRYSTLRPAFEADWNLFGDFLRAQHLESPQAVQCEVTYINNIERGAGWESFADLSSVTPLWAGTTSGGFLDAPESIGLNLAFPMEEQMGRLRVSIDHAFRVRDGKEILRLQLVARGKPISSSTADILAWLNVGHEWVVRAFADITTSKMHALWGRKQ